MKQYKFIVFDRMTLLGRRFFFNITAGNGEIVAQSQAYKSAKARSDTIRMIRVHAIRAPIMDENGELSE